MDTALCETFGDLRHEHHGSSCRVASGKVATTEARYHPFVGPGLPKAGPCVLAHGRRSGLTGGTLS